MPCMLWHGDFCDRQWVKSVLEWIPYRLQNRNDHKKIACRNLNLHDEFEFTIILNLYNFIKYKVFFSEEMSNEGSKVMHISVYLFGLYVCLVGRGYATREFFTNTSVYMVISEDP